MSERAALTDEEAVHKASLIAGQVAAMASTPGEGCSILTCAIGQILVAYVTSPEALAEATAAIKSGLDAWVEMSQQTNGGL